VWFWRWQVQDLPAIVLSPAQYYNYTQPRGNFIPTSLADHEKSSSRPRAKSTMSWWSKDADSKRILDTFHLASGVAATCVLKSPFNSSFDADRLRTMNFTTRSQQLLEKYYEAGCESVFVKGLAMMNFVPPAPVIIDTANNSLPFASGKSFYQPYHHCYQCYYHPWNNVLMFLWRLSVSMSVCNTITFAVLVVESSFLVCAYIFRGYGSRSCMKVIRSRSRS